MSVSIFYSNSSFRCSLTQRTSIWFGFRASLSLLSRNVHAWDDTSFPDHCNPPSRHRSKHRNSTTNEFNPCYIHLRGWFRIVNHRSHNSTRSKDGRMCGSISSTYVIIPYHPRQQSSRLQNISNIPPSLRRISWRSSRMMGPPRLLTLSEEGLFKNYEEPQPTRLS